MKNLTNLILVVAAMFVVTGCCGRQVVESFGKNCVSPDGSQIALTDMYGGVTLIDSKTGNIVTKKEPEKEGQDSDFGVALCTQTSSIFAVYPNRLVNLKDNQRINHQVKGKVFDLIDKDTVLTFLGGELTTDSDGDHIKTAPLELYVEKLGQETKDLAPITVPPNKFEGIRKEAFNYWIKPLRLLDKENLLLIVGPTPRTYSRTPTENYVFPEPWGFYVFNLKTEQAKILGTTKTSDVEINFQGLPKITSTKDGRLISLFTFGEPGNTFAIYDTRQDKEILRKSVEDGEIEGVIFAGDETKIAVMVKYLRGQNKSKAQSFINLYELKTGTLIKSIPLNFEAETLFDFRNDELILFSHKKILKLNINTEGKIWETVYFDK